MQKIHPVENAKYRNQIVKFYILLKTTITTPYPFSPKKEVHPPGRGREDTYPVNGLPFGIGIGSFSIKS